MKLLSPQQIRDGKADELNLDILRIQELKTATDKARLDLANAMADFNITLANNQTIWAKEEEDHIINVKERQAELKVLEERKKLALEPLEFKRRELALLENTLKDALDKVKTREADNEELKELLEDHLDQVGQREVDVLNREQRADVRESGLKRQAEMVGVRTKELSAKIDSFTVRMTKQSEEMDKRKVGLDLVAIELNNRRETLKRTEEALNIKARQVEDQRATLERAMKRLSKT